MNTTRSFHRILVIATVVACAVGSVSADYMSHNGMGYNSTIKIHSPGTPANGNSINAGQNDLNYAGTDSYGYSVSLDESVGSGEATVLSYSSLNNAHLVAYLYETYSTAVSNGTEAAALQAAIWEVIYEKSKNFDLSDGNFSISNNNDVLATANILLENLPDSYKAVTNLLVLHSEDHQDMLIDTNYPSGPVDGPLTPIPEPMTLTMLIGGGVVVLLGKRHRN